ncbi:MAG TPA: DUF190 domain-containing protein [Capsulimonadaceae bacterium]|jgi:hypothetical protein
MKTTTVSKVLRVYIGENDIFSGGPLYGAIVARLRDAGIAGVSVFHGIEGYGAHRRLHTQRLEVLFQGLPVVIEAVDTPEHIEQALATVETMDIEALVTVTDTTAIRYVKG